MVIAGAAGPVMLSIPIQGGRNQKCLMKDVLIDNNARWQDNHWKTIVSCYNRSPWFEHYGDELQQLFQTRFELLMDWNLRCFDWIRKRIGLNLAVSMTEEWRDKYEPDRWLDLRNKFEPHSLNGLQATPQYRQVFEERTGFLPHLSILDLLFCEGKNALQVLRMG